METNSTVFQSLSSLIDIDSLSYYMSICMIVTGVMTLIMLQFMDAPYGRYGSSSWGPPVQSKLAWFFQEIPSLAVPVCFIVYLRLGSEPKTILLYLYCAHYTQRSLIFPFLIRGGKPTPFIAFFLAVVFCTYNGLLQSISMLFVETYPSDWLMRTHVVIGICLFIVGMIINIHSDHILRNLRKPGETGYKIPTGGMFKYVSGANYFGEIMEWCGYSIACSSLASAAFTIFTISNIGPRALSHHRWYKKKFENYPSTRKALIPYVL